MEKLLQSHYFMKATLLFEKTPEVELDKRQLKTIILYALQSLHGQVGGAIQVDVIRSEVHPLSINAILRIPHKDLVKVWSALTLLGSYGNRACLFQVTKVSASLMSLAVDSREFGYKIAETRAE